jgi:hypothetical protein
METVDYKYFFHGSEDSLDRDAYFLVDEPFNFDRWKELCFELSRKTGTNANLISVENGVVSNVYKGTVDEVNNSLYHTYGLHDQIYPCPIERLLLRDHAIKFVRVIRGILSQCSRTVYRKEVKAALNSHSIVDRINTLAAIDFNKIDSFEKNSKEDVYKFIAFQVAQIVALTKGIELYTKSTAAAYLDNPDFTKLLYRQEASPDAVNELIELLFGIRSCFDVNIIDNGSKLVSKFGVIDVKSENTFERFLYEPK